MSLENVTLGTSRMTEVMSVFGADSFSLNKPYTWPSPPLRVRLERVDMMAKILTFMTVL